MFNHCRMYIISLLTDSYNCTAALAQWSSGFNKLCVYSDLLSLIVYSYVQQHLMGYLQWWERF